MVSFVCNYCQETLKKAKLDPHAQRCRNASFSCIDCNVDFAGTTYRQHTSCISETEKYQGKMKKAKPASQGGRPAPPPPTNAPQSTVDQLTARARQMERADADPQSNGAATTASSAEKRRSDGTGKSDSKRKREDKADGGSQAAADWETADLPTDAVEALAGAVAHVCAHEPGTAFGELKRKCIRMVAKHPRATLSKSDAKAAFDKAVLAALSNGTVSLST
ncbi:hypothetical protein LPJ61_001484 [Coemansia biformis]|uniref:Zinc finger C2H2 LYAR-type domain-containing protein n=1 Tax=Coemansia biformis TaxID=1286918 RepID=A0A9W8CY23_9FUNG|nr:hypothetical protein LPJ61_001484 [Coemansia biformis]